MNITETLLTKFKEDKTEFTPAVCKLLWDAAFIDLATISKNDPDFFKKLISDTVRKSFPGVDCN